MRILFDQGTPVPLRRHLHGHDVDTAFERGWSQLENGDLLDAAERDGYALLITTDQNLKYQQNLKQRRISILLLLSTSWPKIRLRTADIEKVVNSISVGEYVEYAV